MNQIDLTKFKSLFKEYVDYCKRSAWLKYHEGYKFRFGRWVNERIDFEKQSDNEILRICLDSQEQVYDEEGNKGINFIKANQAYHDDFITLRDIATLRKLYNGEAINNNDLTGSPVTFPKLSIWAGIAMPGKYRIYANEELINGLALLFSLKADHAKTGIKAFELANQCLLVLSKSISENFNEEETVLSKLVFGEKSSLQEVDKAWVAQDFILFLNRRKLDYKKNYYWVNQGTHYNEEKESNCIATPQDNISHHKVLRELQEGDVVIHYYQSQITDISNVVSEFELIPRPNASENDRSIVVGLNYKQLETPIPHQKVMEIFLYHDFVKTIKNGPFNKNLGIKQTYCNRFNEEAFNLLFNDKMSKKYWMYAPGERASKWDEFYEKGIMALGWYELGDLRQYKNKEDIVKNLQKIHNSESSMKNDATANDEFLNIMKPGDIVFVKRGREELLGFGEVSSDYYYDQSQEHYTSCRKVNWIKKGNWKTDFQLALKTLTDVTNYKTEDPNHEFYYQRVMGVMNDMSQTVMVSDTKNRILYGPPGTGKTFKLSNEYFNRFVSKKTSVSRDEFLRSFLIDKSWWEVIALVLLDIKKAKVADIFNHELLQIKADLSNSTTVTPTIWGQLQAHTIDSCEYVGVKKKSTPLIFNKTADKYWEILEEEVAQQVPELYNTQKKIIDFEEQSDVEIKRYEFVTFHQSFSYEDFIEGIKPNIEDSDNGLNYILEDGVFKKIALRAMKDSNQDYAIFIDEINRGNVAAIFGELITLIEEDKRAGAPNELSVILPYSKKEFKVPANLYIIGTMNTADRSVEALDTALRRRFTFEEVMPQPQIIASFGKSKGKVNGFDLEEILSTINERIEVLIDRDHTIGHSYFMNIETFRDLKLALKDKIIPLLQEYFYGDYGKIGMVLGSGFVERNKDQVSFASFNGFDTSIYHQNERFRLISINEEFDIEIAIKLLLNKSSEE